MFRAHVLIVRRAKIVLYSLWYRYTETSEWSKITKIIKIIKIQFYKYEHMVVKFIEMHVEQNIKIQLLLYFFFWVSEFYVSTFRNTVTSSKVV